MKHRRSCGSCSGCCRNCLYLQKKQEEKAASAVTPLLRSLPEHLFVPAMAVMDMETIPAQSEAADDKVAIVPGQPPQTESEGGTEPALAEFLEQHPKQGRLRVQTFRGPQALPVEGVHVTVSRDFDGKPYIFYEGDTDMSGILDGIALPAAGRDASLAPGQPQPSATYRLTATHPKYETLETTVDIYEGVKTIQLVQLALRTEG